MHFCQIFSISYRNEYVIFNGNSEDPRYRGYHFAETDLKEWLKINPCATCKFFSPERFCPHHSERWGHLEFRHTRFIAIINIYINHKIECPKYQPAPDYLEYKQVQDRIHRLRIEFDKTIQPIKLDTERIIL